MTVAATPEPRTLVSMAYSDELAVMNSRRPSGPTEDAVRGDLGHADPRQVRAVGADDMDAVPG